jgi:hypothetical protein
MSRKLRHPIKAFKRWRRLRKHVVNSKVNLYASRKHKLPLEKCGKEQLEAAVRHNEREAKRYEKAYQRNQRQNYKALYTWHHLCQPPIQELVALLRDGQRVEDIKWKKRRKPTEELMRIRKLG